MTNVINLNIKCNEKYKILEDFVDKSRTYAFNYVVKTNHYEFDMMQAAICLVEAAKQIIIELEYYEPSVKCEGLLDLAGLLLGGRDQIKEIKNDTA